MKEFILKMLSNSDDVSSKRVTGILCILVYIVMFVVVFFSEKELKQPVSDLFTTLFYGGLVLLGIGVIEKLKAVK